MTDLRLLTPNDKDAVHALLCVPEVFKYLADGAAPPPSVARDWVNASEPDNHSFGGGLWGLYNDQEPQILLGLARLSDLADGAAELTYLLHPTAWGHGYAVQMAHTVMGNCFAQGVVSSIWAGADEPNVHSVAVMQKLGMTFKRAVEYPSGAGIEYELARGAYDPARHPRLDV